MMRYRERLEARIAQCGTNLCVGLDPRPEEMTTDPQRFLEEVVEQTAPYAAAYKPNAAYFEAMGLEGFRLLESVLEVIPQDIPIIFDGKRGDIGETQKYYARACFDVWGADAVTLNPYLGRETLEPFLEYSDKGIYLLGVTSNPGAEDLQLRKVGDRHLFASVQDMAREASLGLVIGLAAGREWIWDQIEDLPLLLPGLGAQGGDLAQINSQEREAPLLVNVSRGILFRNLEKRFSEKAKNFADQIEAGLAGMAGTVEQV
ncbi:MAG: orotidine-5'-phosphate decarboxylase [Verrucomicrobiota bacterium]